MAHAHRASAEAPAAAASTSGREAEGRTREQWGEADFGALQKRAAARLHRFYVPQPLGPAPEPASLAALLASSPSPATPSTLPASSSPSPPPAALPSVVLEGEEARHAARALRLAPGDRVELCDGRGNTVAGVVAGSDRQRVWVSPDGPATHTPWRGSRWVLAAAATTLKGGRAEWLVEKAAELGAHSFVPLTTERSQGVGKAKFRTRGGGGRGASSGADEGEGGDDYQPGRLERVAIAATKQSLRPHALALEPPTALQQVLPLVAKASGSEGGFALVAVAGAPPLPTVLAELRSASRQAGAGEEGAAGAGSSPSPLRVLLIGPEGDFTPGELAALVEAGARPVGLGANRLRTETAAIGLLAACLFSEGDS
ncbi:hypothetical protein HYH03_002306 [Edaphochlamys debaryana]|uniref:16S rRNA (uracil(1498)-N(3))-methyltransferase n=1 Tax=Edaphochlamys debaryana TaxID=47281 RepID=A0A835YBR8_9CHLO|nr:hypothetical protein HYH03_002306 [Edaphochlamys debaryana]|eukprot:KAG2500025.1 hypothetical protein HYH03_002306 [Edaphochlamys debaryana]